jgi:predicted permease
MDTLLQDLRFSLRTFRNNPGLGAVAVATLALGIGATTGVFSVADWLMLRPVPGVTGQGRLASVNLGIARDGGRSLTVWFLSYPNLKDLAGRLTRIDGFAGIQQGTVNASPGDAGAIDLPIKFVTSSYSDVLGLQAQLGRWFRDAEDDPGDPAFVAVISDATWNGMYGGDSDVLGRDFIVNGRPFQIVGVAAEGFEGAYFRDRVGAWLPGSAQPWAEHSEERRSSADRDGGSYYNFVARLAERATWQQAQAELDAAAVWLAERYPDVNGAFAPEDSADAVAFHLYPGIGTNPLSRPYISETLGLMLAVASLVLLIACTNVANLLLMHGSRRAGELAVRKSLGAGRWRLARQQLTEGVLLWIFGGVAGVGLALLVVRSFGGLQLAGVQMADSMPLNLRLLAFAVGLALVTGLGFSLLPAWAIARVDAARTLQSGSDVSRGRKNHLRLVFGAAQLAASLTLLVGALLFARTIGNMADVDPGIDPTGTTATWLYPMDIGYSVEQAADYFDRLQQALAAHPSTAGVALSSNVPFYGFKSYGRARSADDTNADYAEPLSMSVSEEYFDLLSIPLLRGRTFTADEVRRGAEIMVVNQAMASSLFGDVDPLGRSIEVPVYRADPMFYEIVGVVANTRFRDLTEEPEPTYFVPRGRGGQASRAVVLLKTRPGANGQEIMRSTIAEVSPSLAPRRIESLEQAVHDASAQSRVLARLLATLAAVAAILAAVGLYAIVSTATAQRGFELGIRLALGSSPARILILVLTGTTSVVALGLGAGLFGAWALSRAIESRLYGVASLDPASWIAAILLLVTVAFIAALIPARRAMRLDPVETLRGRR